MTSDGRAISGGHPHHREKKVPAVRNRRAGKGEDNSRMGEKRVIPGHDYEQSHIWKEGAVSFTDIPEVTQPREKKSQTL